MVLVVKSMNSNNNGSNNTASHLYMNSNGTSLRNLELLRDKIFTKAITKGAKGAKYLKREKGEKGEKGEKEEKEFENEIQDIEQMNKKNKKKDEEELLMLSLDVTKVINTLSVHLEKTQSIERKEKTIDKKRGDIIYKTKDGRVLQAFHSCERGKIIWDDNVYDDLKSWLAAASIVAPSRGD